MLIHVNDAVTLQGARALRQPLIIPYGIHQEYELQLVTGRDNRPVDVESRGCVKWTLTVTPSPENPTKVLAYAVFAENIATGSYLRFDFAATSVEMYKHVAGNPATPAVLQLQGFTEEDAPATLVITLPVALVTTAQQRLPVDLSTALMQELQLAVSVVGAAQRQISKYAGDSTDAAERAEQAAINAHASEVNAQGSATAAGISAVNARDSEQNAAGSASDAADSAAAALASENAAHDSEVAAKASEDAAALSERHAKDSEDNAKASENAAALSESNAHTSEVNAKASEDAAARSEQAAAGSASDAAGSATAAAGSESGASGWATLSRSYAVGGTGTRQGENTDNANYYKGQAADSAYAADQSRQDAASSALSASNDATVTGDNSTAAQNAATSAANDAAVVAQYVALAENSEVNAQAAADRAEAAASGVEALIPIHGNGAPTTATIGQVGQTYVDDTARISYICVASVLDNSDPQNVTRSYIWIALAQLDSSGKLNANQLPVLHRSGAPTTSTAGVIGQTYSDDAAGKTYTCVSIGGTEQEPVYNWKEDVYLDANAKVPNRQLPIAGSVQVGVVAASGSNGISVDVYGNIYISAATTSIINERSNSRRPIVPSNLNYAVRSVSPLITTIAPTADTFNLLDASATTNNHSHDFRHAPVSVPTYVLPDVPANNTLVREITLEVEFPAYTRSSDDDSGSAYAWKHGTSLLYTDTTTIVAGTTVAYSDASLTQSAGTIPAYDSTADAIAMVASYGFEDANGVTITPMSTPSVTAGTVIDFLCRWSPSLGKWCVMPVVME